MYTRANYPRKNCAISCAIACVCELKNKHGRPGQLKICWVSLPFSMKVLFLEEERTKISISETVRKEVKWHKAGRKRAKKDISRAKGGK